MAAKSEKASYQSVLHSTEHFKTIPTLLKYLIKYYITQISIVFFVGEEILCLTFCDKIELIHDLTFRDYYFARSKSFFFHVKTQRKDEIFTEHRLKNFAIPYYSSKILLENFLLNFNRTLLKYFRSFFHIRFLKVIHKLKIL